MRYTGETGQNLPSVLKRIKTEIANDSDIAKAGRKVLFVTLRDFAATWKAIHLSGRTIAEKNR